MPTRRELKFDTFDAIFADAQQLLTSGYDRAGQWSLGQCCGHLNNWMTYQLDGFPKLPLLMRPMFFVFRNTAAPKMFEEWLTSGAIKSGMSTVARSVPPTDIDDTQAVVGYRRAAEKWQAHTGPLHASPLYGEKPREDWFKLHLIHAAHHLSFLIPKK